LGKDFPQSIFDYLSVQGGLITYTVAHIPAVSAAIARFASNVTDPKAGIIPAYNFLLGQVSLLWLLVYSFVLLMVDIVAWGLSYNVLRRAHASCRNLRRIPGDSAPH
jgi:hypothetical protein